MIGGRLKNWWDSICVECGQCCCEKYPYKRIAVKRRRVPGVRSVNGYFFIDYSSPCSYLEIEHGRCMVYEDRFKTCSSCIPMTIFHALFAGYLSADCAYVRKFRPWIRRK